MMDVNMDDLKENDMTIPHQLVSPEQALSLSKRLSSLIDSWQKDVEDELIRYLKGDTSRQYSVKCALTLIFQDLPIPINLNNIFECDDLVQLMKTLQVSSLSHQSSTALSKLILSSL